MMDVQFLPLGVDGVLVRFADTLSDAANRAVLAYHADVVRADLPGVVETGLSLTSTFVRFRPDQTSRAALLEQLQTLLAARDWADVALPEGRRLWHIPAVFEGPEAPDLEAVAEQVGRDPGVAIAELCATRLRVLALGFAPGQPYLGFMGDHWNVPRRTEVTPEVPQGAVVVAVRQVIPFANPAPTGWWQIGRTAFRCYDPATEPPLPLKAGDEIQFHAVPSSEWMRLTQAPRGGAEAEMLG